MGRALTGSRTRPSSIEGGTIRAIGRRSEVRPPDGSEATTHAYGDATIMPGLVDGHTHLVGIGDGTRGDDVAVQDDDLLLIRAALNARATLHSGVTTIRENGSKGRDRLLACARRSGEASAKDRAWSSQAGR